VNKVGIVAVEPSVYISIHTDDITVTILAKSHVHQPSAHLQLSSDFALYKCS